MGRDKVLGLSLAILLIGFAAAFCFRNDPFVEKGLKLARAKILDEAIAQRPGPKPYAPESKYRHDKSNSPTVTLEGIESADPFTDVANNTPSDGPRPKIHKQTDRLAAHVSDHRLMIRPMAEPKMPIIGTLTVETDPKPAPSDSDRTEPPAADTTTAPAPERLSSAEPPADDAAIAAHRGSPAEIIIRPNPTPNRRSFSQAPAWQSAADQPEQGAVADNSTPGDAVTDTPPSGGAVSETPPSGGMVSDNPPSASSAGDSQRRGGLAADNQSATSQREPQTTDSPSSAAPRRSHSFRENAALGTQPGDNTPREATAEAATPDASTPSDTVATDTVPKDAVPKDAVPQDTVPTDMIPAGTVPSDTGSAGPSDTLPPVTLPRDARYPDVTSGDMPNRDIPNRDMSNGDMPTRDMSSGDMPTRNVPNRDMNRDLPNSDTTAGDMPRRDAMPRDALGGNSPPAGNGESPAAIHRVRRGDTLTRIALHYLGDARRYREIFEANRDQLHTPNDRLKIGMALRIPANTHRSERSVARRKSRSNRSSQPGEQSARTRKPPIRNVARVRETPANPRGDKQAAENRDGDNRYGEDRFDNSRSGNTSSREKTSSEIPAAPAPPEAENQGTDAAPAIRFIPARRTPFLPGRKSDDGAPAERENSMAPGMSHYRFFKRPEPIRIVGDREDAVIR